MNRHASQRRQPKPDQRGVAAVELAVLIALILPILIAPFMVARSLMQANLAQRAAYNAIHMIATYPPYPRIDHVSKPVEEAQAMVVDALTEGGVTPPDVADISPNCATSPGCRNAPPDLIDIGVAVEVLDPGSLLPGFGTLSVTIQSTDYYAN
jgi:Flp pilus assembly pilin Flp